MSVMKPIPKTIAHGDLRFSTEAFGNPSDPPVLMIMGATASMLWWPDELCALLAGRGRYVIRYDNRDTGQSTTNAPGAPAYSMDDMADDAMAILDGYGIGSAHLVGMSLGGMIAQLAALKHPARVLSLTLISTCAFDEDDPTLPEMDPAVLEHFGKVASLDWSDREAVIAFQVEGDRISAGKHSAFDVARARRLWERDFDRAINIQSALNHGMLGGGDAWRGKLQDITAPSLVIHGRHDPVLSFAHGKKLAKALDADVVELDAAHELAEKDWPTIVDAIVAFTAKAAQRR